MAKSAIGQAAAAAVAERKGTPLPTPSKNTGSGGSSSGSGSSIAQAAANAVSQRNQTYVSNTPSASTVNRAAEQTRLNAAADAAKKAYEDYLKSSANRQYQKTWGRQSDEARRLYQEYNTAMQERDAHANQSKLQNFVDMASGLRNNTAIQSEVDKQRAVNLGTSKSGDTLGQKGLPFLRNATTEAQRQQKMGYSTWDTEKYQAMSDDEAEIYNRLVKNGHEKEAQEFLDALDSTLNYRVTKARTDKAREAAQDGFIGGAAASAGSTLLNLLGTGAQAELAAMRAMRNDEAIDPYAEEMYGRNLSSTLRGTVSEEVSNWAATLPTVDTRLGAQSGKFKAMPIEQQQESNRKIAEFLYNTGMSMVDMLAMSPMGTAGMSLIMGTNAAADSLIDAKNRGLSDEQAMTISIISGAAEVIAEKYSLDRLFDGKITVSSLRNALIQGGVEASEEAVTELANTLADVFVLGNQSAFEEAITAYMEQGMDYQQAQNKAFVDVLADIAAAGAGGFLSGFVMGGTVDMVNTNAQGRSVIDQTAQTFIKQGQTPEQAQQSAIEYLKEELRAVGALADEGTTAYELSQRTGDMSTGDIGRAYLANREQIQNIVSSGKAKYTSDELTAFTPATQQEAMQMDATTPQNLRRYQSEITAALNGEMDADQMVVLGRPSQILGRYMNPDNPLMLAQNVVKKVSAEDGKHQLNRIILDELPYQFDDPVAITGNTVKHEEAGDNSIVVWTDWQVGGQDPVVVPIRIDAKGNIGLYNNINSAFPLYDPKYMEEMLRDGNILYTRGNENILDILAQGREVPKRKVEDVYTDSISEPAEPVNIPERIAELEKQYNELPLQDSREGIEIQRKISDLQAQMETETPQAGGTKVQDSIGGTDPVPDDVRNNAENRKRIERDHEKLKKQLNIPEDITSEIETYVKKNVPIERVVRLLTEDGIHPQMTADYYSSYKELYDSDRAAVRYRKEVLNKRYTRIRDAVARTLPKWEDKKTGVAYSRGTQERNIQDIAKKAPEAAKWITQNIFEPVHRNEAARNRWMNQYADRARAHDLTKIENEFVHVLITERDLEHRKAWAEKDERDAQKHNNRKKEKDAKNLIKRLDGALDDVRNRKAELFGEDPTLDEDRGNDVADDILSIYREIYDQLVEIQMKNGMPVTEFRSTYAPVVKDKKGRTILSYIGVELGAQEIPTSIAGLTDTFKPGKPWFSHDLRRTDFHTAYDILGGLDEYLNSAGDVIFHTDDIQNVRMLENVIRSATTKDYQDDMVKEWIDEGITGDQLNQRINEEFVDNTHLSNYVRNLREYGNLLANKKSVLDRGFENLLGRGIYKTMNNVKSRIVSNVLGGNVSVVLSQLIPLTQAAGVVSGKNLLRGIEEAGKAYGKDDGFNERSTFITNRTGYKQAAFKDAVTKVTDAVAKPFEVVDEVVASAVVRGRYYDNIAKGMSETAAMRDADRIAAALIADRSKGALPTIFGSKNPLSTLITMFQVESNNQIDFLLKDMKIEAGKDTSKNMGAAYALALSKIFILGFMYDEARKLLGLSANALDPINWVRDASEEIRKGIDEEQSISETVGNIWDNTREQIPFIGGGRYGSIYENALPDIGAIADAVQDAEGMEENAGKYIAQTALEELSKPALYLGLPTGGAQLKKTAQAVKALAEGGSYKINNQGEKRLQYTVVPTLGNIAGGILFGKGGFKENKEWKTSGFDSFSTKEQDAFQSLKGHGGDASQFGEYRTIYRNMVEADNEKNTALRERRDEILMGNPALTSAEAMERAEMDLGYTQQNSALKWAQQISRDSSLTDEQKADLITLADLGADDIEDLRALTNFGVPVSDYVSIITTLAGEESITSDVKKKVSQQIFDTRGLTVEQKTALARKTIGDDWIVDYSSQAAHELTIIGKSAYNDWQEVKAVYGVSADDYLKYRNGREAVQGEKDENGKTIAYTKKAAVANFCEQFPESFRAYVADYYGYEMDKLYGGIKQVDGIWVVD